MICDMDHDLLVLVLSTGLILTIIAFHFIKCSELYVMIITLIVLIKLVFSIDIFLITIGFKKNIFNFFNQNN